MERSKVTIIVPIYNVEKYVSKCLDSLINQTMDEIEVFAIIDGSPDNSIDIVKKYASMDSRIKCFDKENGGYGSVLEYALDKIETEYFLICDPDDWLEINAVETLYKVAIETNADIVVGDKYLVYSDDNKTEYSSSIMHNKSVIPNKLYFNDEVGKFVNLSVSPHSKLFKTRLANKIQFPRKVNYTDFLLYMISISHAKSAIHIDKALSYYLIDRIGNSVTDVSLKAINSIVIVFNETLKILENQNCNNDYLYYGMYNEARHIILNMASKLSKENYILSKSDIKNCFILLKPYKKCIEKHISFDRKLKQVYNKVLFRLLMNDSLRNITIGFIIKVLKIKKFS